MWQRFALPGLVCSVITCLVFANASASPHTTDWAGHIKGLGQSLDNASFIASDLRLKAQHDYQPSSDSHARWTFKADYQLQAVASDNPRNLPATNDHTQVFNLQHTLLAQHDATAQHRLDRLAVSYTQTNYSVNLGRQAFSWGQGRIFNPLDLFNPFAPTAFDQEYKPGSDMIHAQWLMDSGDDVSALIVPRRNSQTHNIESDHSSYALFWRHFATIETHIMLAKDYEDTVLGLSFGGNLLDGQWNLEIMPTQLANGDIKTTGLINYHQAWSWGQRNISGFIEGFYNGFGVAPSAPTSLPNALVARLQRGQLFTTNQYYAGLGATIDITALSNISVSTLNNLHDQSALVMVNGLYSLSDSQQLVLGLQQGFGRNDSEFNNPAHVQTRAYVQWALYF